MREMKIGRNGNLPKREDAFETPPVANNLSVTALGLPASSVYDMNPFELIPAKIANFDNDDKLIRA
jgi:hypothetical protein